MKRAVLTMGDGRLEHGRIDQFCGLLADRLSDLIPKGGAANVTVRLELTEALQPARFSVSIADLAVSLTQPERRRRRS